MTIFKLIIITHLIPFNHTSSLFVDVIYYVSQRRFRFEAGPCFLSFLFSFFLSNLSLFLLLINHGPHPMVFILLLFFRRVVLLLFGEPSFGQIVDILFDYQAILDLV